MIPHPAAKVNRDWKFSGASRKKKHILEMKPHTERMVCIMKIVVLRSPALLTPLLRKLFGIPKEKMR